MISKRIFILIIMASATLITFAKPMNINSDSAVANVKHIESLQKIIDEANVSGSILVYDLANDQYLTNDFQWAKIGRLPASTFKVPNSIIALETGVVQDDSTVFKWDGKKRYLKVWEQDLEFRSAFQFSCVPCYQEIARKIGPNRMNEYLTKFDYGKMDVNAETIDKFWLEGSSKISQIQQINFLKKLYKSELPISQRTEMIMKKLMSIEKTENYEIFGKTGWSVRNGNNNGWFVGWVQLQSKVYFFATNVEPKEKFNMDMFPKIRTEITMQAFRELKIIE